MQVGGTLSENERYRPERGHRTTRNPSSFSTPTPMQFMDNRNVDDVMQGSMPVTPKSSLLASGILKRPILAVKTESPLGHQVNDNTSHASHIPSMSKRQYLDLGPKYRGTGASLPNSSRRKGIEKIDNLFQHEKKERKRNEPTISSKIKDILEWKLGTGVHHQRKENGDHGNAKKTEKAAENMRDLGRIRRIDSSRNKGPKAGQIYEIVNQHVIEDSTDRTVTISTWREQVDMDQGHGSDTDSTSVYYISPGGYAREDAHIVEVNADFARQLLRSWHKSKKEIQGTHYGAIEANNGPPSRTTKGRNNSKGYRHVKYNDIGSKTTDPLREELVPVGIEKHTRSRAKEGDASNILSQGSLTELKVPDGLFMLPQHHYQESTPIEKKLPQAPFHPTRSGSTISSIRSVSTSDFEKFLDGCNPSLVHVSDILKTLGMYKLEHLKAVARLSPEMRDREVKQVALRLGMTVVEWAILLDKIFQL